jgi:hypothetical protein
MALAARDERRKLMPTLGGPQAHSRFEAELERVTRVLEGYGVLRRDTLGDLCHAQHWSHADFDLVLDEGVRRGRLKRLGSELYEVAHPPAFGAGGAPGAGTVRR